MVCKAVCQLITNSRAQTVFQLCTTDTKVSLELGFISSQTNNNTTVTYVR